MDVGTLWRRRGIQEIEDGSQPVRQTPACEPKLVPALLLQLLSKIVRALESFAACHHAVKWPVGILELRRPLFGHYRKEREVDIHVIGGKHAMDIPQIRLIQL